MEAQTQDTESQCEVTLDMYPKHKVTLDICKLYTQDKVTCGHSFSV